MDHIPDKDLPDCKKKNITSFALTEKQWRLIHGESTTTNPSSTRANIREDKIQKLPKRFSHLFEYVVTLAEENVFAEGLGQSQLDYDKLFREIINTDRASKRYSNFALTPHVHDRNARENREFGLELGRMAYYLCRNTDLAEQQSILYGFFMGLFVDSVESDGVGITPKQMNELESNIQFLKEEVKTWGQMAGHSMSFRKDVYENISDPQRITKEILKEFDITLSDTVISNVQNNVDISIPMVGNSESTRTREKNKVIDYVKDMTQYTNIVQIEDLYSTVKSDLEELSDERKNKQDGEKLVQQAVEIGGAFPNSDLNIDNKRGAEYLLEKFAGKEEPLHPDIVDSTPWIDRPLLTKKGSRWEATPYAELLLRIDSLKSDEDIHPIDLFHRYVLDKNKLSRDDKQLIEAGLEVI